ncbi:MAG: bifunctional phosphopantothenoylcysteine decarboxylase/phosphopantothenate--cysteine ligase CoaBC [bacterium]
MARILLGVTGSIAAYKAAELSRLLTKSGHKVTAVLTRSAREFITPTTFEGLTGQRAYGELFESGLMLHIELERTHEVLAVAPATADVVAKIANGIADDLLTSILLCKTKPAFVAPAMNPEMYENTLYQDNLKKISRHGFRVLDPQAGLMACGEEGVGRMMEPADIQAAIESHLRPKDLSGVKVLVTAGGTQEPLDGVRFLSNPSTGKMGYAVAQEAASRGAEVHLVSGPTLLAPPAGVQFHAVRTARDMEKACLRLFPKVNAVVMAAAVSDFAPEKPRAGKPPKRAFGDSFSMRLIQTPDILNELGRKKNGQVLVGFAAQWGAEHVEEEYVRKLKHKHLDLLVANDVSQKDSGFGADTNRATLVFPDGTQEALPLMSKAALAREIVDRLAALLNGSKARHRRGRKK